MDQKKAQNVLASYGRTNGSSFIGTLEKSTRYG